MNDLLQLENLATKTMIFIISVKRQNHANFLEYHITNFVHVYYTPKECLKFVLSSKLLAY